MNRPLIFILGCWTACAVLCPGLRADPVPVTVPNGSFESPVAPFVNINIDSWQKTAKPPDYDESGGFLWTQLTGIFKNTATNSSDHIDNCDGAQGIWLFATPQVGVFQDYDSVDWNDMSPPHDFNVIYEVGKQYDLTVGIVGTGGGMQQGATLELSFYYRDAQSNLVTVAAATVTNLANVFSNNTHLVDCTLHLPVVRSTNAWAGQHLGIRFLSTVTADLEGGYWDLDNVRLTRSPDPALVNLQASNGQFQYSLLSETGLVFQILSTTNVALPLTDWTTNNTVTNLSGIVPLTAAALNPGQRFYRARLVP